MAVPFGPYQGQDLTEYQAGNRFLPRQFYSLNTAPSTALASTVGNTGGVTGTEAAYPYIWPTQGEGGGNIPPISQNISDFQTAVEGRQKRLQDPNKISQWLGNFLPQQRSAQDILASGEKDVRATQGIPFGIGAMINRALPDKYYDMPRGDQAFIQSQMGYSDPNTQQGNQDPFGVNIRSMFGNYADFVVDEADKLEAIVADQQRRGLTNTLQMKKLRYYKPLRMKRQNIQSDAALIDKGKAAAAEQHQAQQQHMEQDRQGGQNPSAQSFRSAPGGLSQAESRAARGDPQGTGGGWKWAEGGRVGYAFGRGPVLDENVDENIFEIMQDQGVPHSDMVEGASPFDVRVQELIDEGLSWQEAYETALKEFGEMAEGEESFSDQGLASIV